MTQKIPALARKGSHSAHVLYLGLGMKLASENAISGKKKIHLGQGFSNFFPGVPNFSIKILRDPKHFFKLAKASERGELVEIHITEFISRFGVILVYRTFPFF